MAAIMETQIARRPLKSRQAAWAGAGTKLLVQWRISPNAVSIASVCCALVGALAISFFGQFAGSSRVLLLVIAVAGIQGRLVCNLLDGMVAVEGGRKTRRGEIYNDLPDRISDSLFFISAGYAARPQPFSVELGYIAAALAIFTAHIRMLGGAAGLKQSFIGPMAKQHRMAVLTAGCVLSVLETRFFPSGTACWIALVIIDIGCVITIWRRTAHIARELESR